MQQLIILIGILCDYSFGALGNHSFNNSDLWFHNDHVDSSKYVKTNEGYEYDSDLEFYTEPDRSLVYGDDESSSYMDATQIVLDEYQYGLFNFRNDIDYWQLQSSSSCRIMNLQKDSNSIINVFQKSIFNQTTYYTKVMSFSSNDTSGKLFLYSNTTYYFVLKQNHPNYIDEYSFKVSFLTDSFTNYYLKVNYSTSGFFSNYNVVYCDTSNQAYGSIQSTFSNNFVYAITSDESANLALNSFSNKRVYHDSVFSGIYKDNGLKGTEDGDDNRRITPTHLLNYYYPGCAVSLLEGSMLLGSDYYRASAFFVHNDYLMSCCHAIVSDLNDYLVFSTNVRISPGACSGLDGSNNNEQYYGKYLTECAYIPCSYISNLNNAITKRSYDWSILKLGSAISIGTNPITNTYLGVKYAAHTNGESILARAYGYPVLCGGEQYLDSVIKYSIRLTTSSDYIVYNASSNVFGTNIDLTPGNSGGPIYEIDENSQSIYVLGICSGLGVDENILTPINQSNFGLLQEIIYA